MFHPSGSLFCSSQPFVWCYNLLLQCASVVHDYMVNQPDINAKMRGILVDWLIEVHRKFELMPETLYLTINIVDRFLCVKAVSRRELQLVGISSMLIASKYEEIWAPEVLFFAFVYVTFFFYFPSVCSSILGFLENGRSMTSFAFQTMPMWKNRYWLLRKQYWKSWDGYWLSLLLMSFLFDISKPQSHRIRR